jgi:hypothetical protein
VRDLLQVVIWILNRIITIWICVMTMMIMSMLHNMNSNPTTLNDDEIWQKFVH